MAITLDTSANTGATLSSANPLLLPISPTNTGPNGTSILVLGIVLASTATRTGTFYRFTVTAANATAGATYTNNAQTFTVAYTIAGETTLVCSGTGAPTASGTLTRATGTGDATITYSANAATTTTPTVNGQVMTTAGTRTTGSGGSAIAAETWYYLNPPATLNIVVPNLGALSGALYAAVFDADGSCQLAFDLAGTAGTGNGTALTASVTPTSNTGLIFGFGCSLSNSTISAGASRTLISSVNATTLAYAAEYLDAVTAVSTAMPMTASVTGRWIMKTIAIREFSKGLGMMLGAGS